MLYDSVSYVFKHSMFQGLFWFWSSSVLLSFDPHFVNLFQTSTLEFFHFGSYGVWMLKCKKNTMKIIWWITGKKKASNTRKLLGSLCPLDWDDAKQLPWKLKKEILFYEVIDNMTWETPLEISFSSFLFSLINWCSW